MIDKIKGGIDMMPIPDALKTYAKNALEGTIPEVKIENPLKTGGSGKSGNITPTSSASKFSNVSSTVQSTAQTSNKSQSSNSTTVISTPTTISNKSSFVLPGLGPAVQGDALSAIYGM